MSNPVAGFWDALSAAARNVRERAYAPYSGYAVGAALRGPSGEIWTGCNLENASYGATLCAERAALAAMVGAGMRQPEALALWTENGGAPCGLCLQALAEFAPPEMPVGMFSDGGETVFTTLGELLPRRFSLRRAP